MRCLALADFFSKGNAAFHAQFGGRVRTWGAGLAFALALGLGSGAEAATITFEFEVEFSGGDTPEGTPSFVTATFDDSFGGSNDVRLTLSSIGLVDAESINRWFFNFDPALDPTQLTFTAVNDAASVPNAILTGADAFQVAGSGRYDIRFDFAPPPGGDGARFTAGETIVYDLSYISPIFASSFDFDSVDPAGNGTFRSAAHVTRIGDEDGSGWIGGVPAPEPSTALLLGVGLVGLAAGRERSALRGRHLRR